MPRSRSPWVSGDEVYGQDPHLRHLLQERQVGYVLAIAGNRRVNLEGADLLAAQIITTLRHTRMDRQP